MVRGAGLTNMADRLGAIGGSLQIESAPGRGRDRGAIPLSTLSHGRSGQGARRGRPAPFRDAARAVLRATPGFELVGEAARAKRLSRSRASSSPTRAHGRQHGGDGGIEATRRIAAARPGDRRRAALELPRGGPPEAPRAMRRRRYVPKGEFGRQRARGALAPARARSCASARKRSTALTRRWTVRLPREPELLEDRVDVLLHRPLGDDERAAIAALFLPCAISARVSRSRGVSAVERRSAARSRRRAPRQPSDRSTDPPGATSWIAAASYSTSLTRSFRR